MRNKKIIEIGVMLTIVLAIDGIRRLLGWKKMN